MRSRFFQLRLVADHHRGFGGDVFFWRVLKNCTAAAITALLAACASAQLPELPSPAGAIPPVAPATGATAPTSPPGSAQTAVATAPAAPAVALPPAAVQSDQETIVGFRGKTVVLFRDPTSNAGERSPTSGYALPILARKSAGNRLEISTSYGPRWVARSEVVATPQGAPASAQQR